MSKKGNKKEYMKIFAVALKVLIFALISYLTLTLFLLFFYRLDIKKNLAAELEEEEDPELEMEMFPHQIFPNSNRVFKHSNELIDYSLLNTSADECTDFYEYACGMFDSSGFDLKDEAIQIIYNENQHKRDLIDRSITQKKSCIDPHYGCINAHNYYIECSLDKRNKVDRVSKIINELTTDLRKEFSSSSSSSSPSCIQGGIRFLVENGITNFIHLTKEKTNLIPESWTLDQEANQYSRYYHYLRPGGVLFPEQTIHLGLYDNQLKSSHKEKLTIEEFLTEISDGEIERTIFDVKLFGKHAQSDDIVYVENINYFINLVDLLTTLSDAEILNRLSWYIRNSIKYFNGRSCLHQTKLLFPITTCKSYLLLSKLDEKILGLDNTAQNVYNTFSDKEVGINVGGCGSLLHSTDKIYEVENNKTFSISNNDYNYDLYSIYKIMFRGWYKFYDPIYLYFTYPRILDHLEDPLDWYTQVNAFYDPFHNEVNIPPGIMQYPIYHHNYCEAGKYSRFGYIVGHELGHALLQRHEYVEEQRIKCLGLKNEEIMADVVGLSHSLKVLGENEDRCKFFLSYAQTFCAKDPHKVYDAVHSSAYDRVNIPIFYGDKSLIEIFNECFQCKNSILEECRL